MIIRDTVDKIKALIAGRSFAYNQVFDRKSRYAELVLKDLAKFCRAHETCFHKDPRIHAMLEGRREVFLRIQEYLDLDVEEIVTLHRVKDMEKHT